MICGEAADTVGCDGDANFVAGAGGNDTVFDWTRNETLVGGAGESVDTILDCSFAQGDAVDVPGSGAGYTFAQTGADVTVYDPTSTPIFVLQSYTLSNGLIII